MLLWINYCHPGYDIRHVDRERRGGGVALIYKKDISFRNIIPTNEITQFELLDCIIKVNKLSTRLVVVYRPHYHVKMD